MIIDTHAHIIVPEITRQMAPDETWRPSVVRENGRQIIDFAGKQFKAALRELSTSMAFSKRKKPPESIMCCCVPGSCP